MDDLGSEAVLSHRFARRVRAGLMLAAALAALVAAPAAASSAPAGPPRPDHVMVVVFENKSFAHLRNPAKAAYLDGLFPTSAVFTDATAETHPSQPNYLALFSGSTQGVTDDRCPLLLSARPNLASQVLAAGLSFAGYSEDLPYPGYEGCRSAGYAAKHVPWVHFANVPASVNLPYSALPGTYDRLPTVSFVIPDLCDDMHDCGTEIGDRWAAAHLPAYLSWAGTHNSLLIITFDENDGTPNNQILTLFAGAHVRPGEYPEPVNHYSILRTIEDMYGLAPLGAAAAATPITDAWR